MKNYTFFSRKNRTAVAQPEAEPPILLMFDRFDIDERVYQEPRKGVRK